MSVRAAQFAAPSCNSVNVELVYKTLSDSVLTVKCEVLFVYRSGIELDVTFASAFTCSCGGTYPVYDKILVSGCVSVYKRAVILCVCVCVFKIFVVACVSVYVRDVMLCVSVCVFKIFVFGRVIVHVRGVMLCFCVCIFKIFVWGCVFVHVRGCVTLYVCSCVLNCK